MGRNRNKPEVVPFSSAQAYEDAMKEEHSRYSTALNALTRKYAPEHHTGARKKEMWVMDRIYNAFNMEERHHEAILAKIEARKPEGA